MGKDSIQLEIDVLLQLEAMSKQSHLMRWHCLVRDASWMLVLQHEDQLLISLNTIFWTQSSRGGGLELVFWHS